MHRRTNNRHAPPNAMLNYFWEKLPGFLEETRPKPITAKDPNVYHPAAVCTGPVSYADLGLVEEFKTVSRYARTPVKVTMTGPHMLSKVAWDEHYGDMAAMMKDIARVLKRNFEDLESAGCRYVQIDEPFVAISDDTEVKAAVEAINYSIESLKDMSVQVHVCQGNYAVGPEYDGQIGHRYFDTGRYPAELICKINCDVLLIEHDCADAYEPFIGEKYLAVGTVDVQSVDVETPQEIVERMNHLPREVAFGKLASMVCAQGMLRAL